MDAPTGYVDLHCHLLTGLDDGPADHDAARELCQSLVQVGTRCAAATCHQLGNFKHNTAREIRQATEVLKENLARSEVSLTVRPSAEWFLNAETLERLEDFAEDLVTLADRGRHALVEFPIHYPPHVPLLIKRFEEIQLTPVIAHVERYPRWLHHPKRVRELVEAGAVCQVNADSIAGRHGAETERACRRMIQRGLVQIVASDTHSLDRRPSRMNDAFAIVARWTNEATARLLFIENPGAVFEGEPVRPAEPIGWFDRLRKRSS